MSPQACPSGKRMYQHRDEAARALRGIRERQGGEAYVYRCPACDGFHLARRRKFGRELPRHR